MNIEVLYQDDYFIIVNKPANLLVHPYKEAKQDKTCLMKELKNQTGLYLYPIHRLDRPVSGIISFALKPEVVTLMQEIWHSSAVKKKYITLVRGHYLEAGQLDFELGDKNKVKKDALTKYTPLELYKQATLLEVEIFTGRYHQIRRHFARSVNHVLGDRTYGKKKYNDYYRDNYGLESIFLHSHFFSFTHPITKEQINLTCPLTNHLQTVLNNLENEHIEELSKNNIVSYG